MIRLQSQRDREWQRKLYAGWVWDTNNYYFAKLERKVQDSTCNLKADKINPVYHTNQTKEV